MHDGTMWSLPQRMGTYMVPIGSEGLDKFTLPYPYSHMDVYHHLQRERLPRSSASSEKAPFQASRAAYLAAFYSIETRSPRFDCVQN